MTALALPSGPLAVVAVGAHPDDIEIGCGATLLRLARRPDTTIRTLVMTGDDERRAEARAAATAFGLTVEPVFAGLADGRLPAAWDETKTALHAFADAAPADLVFVPRADDAHQDHALLGALAPTVWRHALVLHYEIPKWDGDLGRPNVYVAADDADARRKVELLHASFASQTGRDWWDDEFFLGLMRLRGAESRARYAEAFTVTKAVLAL